MAMKNQDENPKSGNGKALISGSLLNQMRGQLLDRVFSSLPIDSIAVSDMQEEILIAASDLNCLTPAGREQYKNIWNAVVHDVRPCDDTDGFIARLEGVAAAELEEFYNDFDFFMEAEQKMGY